MKNELKSPRRRTLVQRGLLLFSGVVGASLPWATARAATSSGRRLKLYGEYSDVRTPRQRNGNLPSKGDRITSQGELLDAPGAQPVGEFCCMSFSMESPFDSSTVGIASLDFHVFQLAGGNILGQATGSSGRAGQIAGVITGGTGKYQGITGHYTARQAPREMGGDGTAEFTFEITRRDKGVE